HQPYKLPKELPFTHPRAEMARQLLALANLKEPLRLDAAGKKDASKLRSALDTVNKDLLAVAKQKGIQPVQVLTNRPETEFYVAAVIRNHEPRPMEFVSAYRDAPGDHVQAPDAAEDLPLIEHAQAQAGKAFRDLFMERLRQRADRKLH